jgi:hypothetical protein
MNPVPVPAPSAALAPTPSPVGAGSIGAPHLAMGSPNLLAYPVILPGAGSNSMPQLALR